ncbi:GTP-binding protein [Steroidobacter cummioxidans]|uniref:GTP-binding protein n=1 Tax=Steroidobacter cummioxidans TaxID=1803913 RepID=UPI000E3158F7|nr:GTPase domain-containing protein [Steroidobacter cummioxidans]
MAVIDPNDDCVVIRVVYDGAPMAGKTTSVRTLGRGFGAGVYSPADLNGRTLYFDWLDYTGGLFEGRRIRCQIISVPGQATLAPRRRRLLESADVVVFVGDSSPKGFAADRRYLVGLRGVLNKIEGPPIGIVLQANKRDLADAVSLQQVRGMLDDLELRSAIIESIATEGSGIRETFVFAVRLALDRVRELMHTGALITAQPKINSAEDLLKELKRAESSALDMAVESGKPTRTRMGDAQSASLASQALQEVMQANIDAPASKPVIHEPRVAATGTEERTPAPPDEKVASGMVWPPVDGRLILHETSSGQAHLQRDSQDGWTGSIANRWSLHSAADAVFDNIDAGRAELVQWARQHVAGGELLSKQRCIVLAPDGQGRYRLWQIVRIESSLRTQMEQALLGDAGVIASSLLTVARSFMTMAERMSAAMCELQLTLDHVGAAGSAYLGFIPLPSQMRPARSWSASQASELLLSELAFARPTLRARRGDLLAELWKLSGQGEGQPAKEWRLLQRLAALAKE